MTSLKEWMTKSRNTPPEDWENEVIQDGFQKVEPDQLDEDPKHVQCIGEGEIFTRKMGTVENDERIVPLIQPRKVEIAVLYNGQDNTVQFKPNNKILRTEAPHIPLKRVAILYRNEDISGSSLENVRKSKTSTVAYPKPLYKQPHLKKHA